MLNPRRRTVRLREAEEQPLLNRNVFGNTPEQEPLFSCNTNPHAHLPVYTNIHRIRRDVISIVEDYLTLEQLTDIRLNISVVRPLVDKLYEKNDISIVYCLLVNRSQFLHEQEHMTNRQNVHFTRATLCELVATRILRRFGDDNPGSEGLLLLANILVAGFGPFQNAPEEVRQEAYLGPAWSQNRTLPALEVAVLTSSKHFLSSTHCQKVVNAIYIGQVIYTPSTFLDMIPDRYKQKPISLYEPHEAPLLNQYRLIVPRTRNMLEITQFVILLILYLLFMLERKAEYLSILEVAFSVYAFGWVLDQFATLLAHGWNVYTQNLWSFLDVMFVLVYWAYIILRIYGWKCGQLEPGQQALDVLAMGAPVLVPRLAFNLLSDNLVFLSLRSMMADFTLLTALAGWCFGGFLLSMVWLAEGRHNIVTISKWMLWIWFGLDGTGISRSTEFHWLLGPTLMVTFAFLGNTLFLTILVSMLSNTFSTIVSNATAEIQFRKAVLTLEGVKSDAIFAYQPPFNIIALFILVPMRFVVSPRWFHKIHVATVRTINLPVLLFIAVIERRLLWSDTELAQYPTEQLPKKRRSRSWFWERWRITSHGDMQAVFDIAPPDSVENDIAVDDELTHHMIRRQFARNQTSTLLEQSKKQDSDDTVQQRQQQQQQQQQQEEEQQQQQQQQPQSYKPPSRRDSIAPYGMLTEQIRAIMSESSEIEDLTSRLGSLERTTSRIEEMLARICSSDDDDRKTQES
ncbi:nonselective cation channel [Annulohypoxylon truncatum]|uniref:nonselective cation channel n=1 Tax=Annulohypoxylon truncatum TaxID=327061 RepID=UPI002008E344|nr:nonselective cation channel [Annulohypoxylon truncatum]KAI1208747.1 nonselective cation channel [Annulohypoxylon truncatum]